MTKLDELEAQVSKERQDIVDRELLLNAAPFRQFDHEQARFVLYQLHLNRLEQIAIAAARPLS